MEEDESEKTGSESEVLEESEQEPEEEEERGKEEEEVEEEEQEESAGPGRSKKKRVVPGIVYLGHVPPRFRPLHVRNLLSAYGEVGRVFFQAEGRCWVGGVGSRCRARKLAGARGAGSGGA